MLETGIPRKSDENGLYQWRWAPDDEVTYRISKEGYANLETGVTADGQEHVVTLQPLLNVSGSVTDARTGAYIDRFQVVPVIHFRPDFLLVNRRDAVDGRDGRFEIEFDRTDIEHGVQVEAEGYRTQVAGPWKIGDPNPALEVRLDPARPIQTTVVGTGGRPVADAKVHFATHTQHLDLPNHEDESFSNNFIRRTADDGRVSFPQPYEPYALIAIHEAGYAEVRREPSEQPGRLELRPWARVQGRLLSAGEPVAGQRVRLDPIRLRSCPQPRIDETFWTTTDKEGRYVFEHVPPVKCSLSGYLTVWNEFPFSSSQSVPLDLQPGADLSIDLNGGGAEVTGRVVLTGETRGEIDLNYSLNYLVALRHGIERPASLSQAGFDWREGWNDAWMSSEEGRSYLSTLHHHFVKLSRDGAFHVSGVAPGEYELAFRIYEPPEHGCLVQPAATHQIRFNITEAHLSSGLDLGSIEVEAFRGPRPGELAPDFTVEMLDGSTQSLSDLRGKHVLIDVWASWCAPCVAGFPAIRELHQDFAGEQLVVMGLNLDQDVSGAKDFVRRHDLPWRQAFVGQGRDAAFSTRYGIGSIPAYLLIDPDGKLVHKGYQLEELRELLQATLSSKPR